MDTSVAVLFHVYSGICKPKLPKQNRVQPIYWESKTVTFSMSHSMYEECHTGVGRVTRGCETADQMGQSVLLADLMPPYVDESWMPGQQTHAASVHTFHYINIAWHILRYSNTCVQNWNVTHCQYTHFGRQIHFYIAMLHSQWICWVTIIN